MNLLIWGLQGQTLPRGNNEPFKVNEKVDVYSDNGSHKGTVKDILENSRYAVGFDGECSEGIVFL